MTIEVHNVQRMRVITESTFGTDASTGGTLFDVPFVEGSGTFTIDRAMLNPEFAQQHIDGYPTQVLGLKSCTLNFTMNLAPTGLAADDDSPTTQVGSGTTALGEILKAVMGGENLGIGENVVTGTSSTVFTLDDATTSKATEGAVIGLPTGANSAYEMRMIEDEASDVVTLHNELTSAPTAGVDDAHGCATYFMTANPSSSLQFIIEGLGAQNRFVLMGMQAESIALELPIGLLPKITFSLKGVSWLKGSDANYPSTGALGAANYVSTTVLNLTGEFNYLTTTATTNALQLVSNVTYTPNISYGPVTSPHGVQAVSRWRRLRAAPVMAGEFVLPFEEEEFMDDRTNKTLQQIWLQYGNTAGSSVLIGVPTAQIVNTQDNDADGIASQTISWQAQLNGQTTKSSDPTDLERSAFVIALG